VLIEFVKLMYVVLMEAVGVRDGRHVGSACYIDCRRMLKVRHVFGWKYQVM
jgi:hypothetical protein